MHDPYLTIAHEGLRLISVFDDLRYDRADLDLLGGPMRARLLRAVAPHGYRQRSGGVIENPATGMRMVMPKFRALGASPFDAVRDTPRGPGEYYVLTPTQAACVILDSLPSEEALAALEALIAVQPVNLLRIFDYLGQGPDRPEAKRIIGHLTPMQRAAIRAEPLMRRRALS